MTQRMENLLGALALFITDEINALPAADTLSGPTARAMLNAVGQYPDASIETLREAVDLSHPAAVRAIAALVNGGLVEKKTGTDKRTAALALTSPGKREVKRLQGARDKVLQRIAGRLDEHERDVLENLLIKILWSETRACRAPSHAMQLCRLCDDKPCLEAGCPVECGEHGLPMPETSDV